MNYRKYKVSETIMMIGAIISSLTLLTSFFSIPLNPIIKVSILIAVIVCFTIGFYLQSSLLLFIRQFTDISKRSAILLIIARYLSLLSIVFLLLNTLYSYTIAYMPLLVVSLMYRTFSDGREIDEKLKGLCQEVDIRLLTIGIEEKKL